MSSDGFEKENGIRSCKISKNYYELLKNARKKKVGVLTPLDLKSSISNVAR
jgi:hypothetical protein